MEEKIYERQVTKLSIALRVIDEEQIDRHFTQEEVGDLYAFNRIGPMSDDLACKSVDVSISKYIWLLFFSLEGDLNTSPSPRSFRKVELRLGVSKIILPLF